MKRFTFYIILLWVAVVVIKVLLQTVLPITTIHNSTPTLSPKNIKPDSTISLDPFTQKLVTAAKERAKVSVTYDARYLSIDYPNGDVPQDIGVCTDEIIRIYRQVGIDLQKEVHEDMLTRFNSYPKIWGLKKPDTNIDHRRVQNLMTYFNHKKANLPVTQNKDDYKPGDIVTWNLGPGHIGIVTDLKNTQTGNFIILHNAGRGPQLEDVLFSWPITGHYRYVGVR